MDKSLVPIIIYDTSPRKSPRTVVSYCAALSSCERLGAWRQAFEVLTAMEGAKLRSDVTWMAFGYGAFMLMGIIYMVI